MIPRFVRLRQRRHFRHLQPRRNRCLNCDGQKGPRISIEMVCRKTVEQITAHEAAPVQIGEAAAV